MTTPDRLVRVPDALPLTQAATIPTAAETAQRALALLDAQAGETVVVNAAAGSVGSAAVQLLIAAGVRVIGTASEVNHDYVRALGATPVRYGDHLIADLAPPLPTEWTPHSTPAVEGSRSRCSTLVEPSRIVTIVDFAAARLGVQIAAGDPFAVDARSLAPVLDLAAQGRFATEVAGVRALRRRRRGAPSQRGRSPARQAPGACRRHRGAHA